MNDPWPRFSFKLSVFLSKLDCIDIIGKKMSEYGFMFFSKVTKACWRVHCNLSELI